MLRVTATSRVVRPERLLEQRQRAQVQAGGLVVGAYGIARAGEVVAEAVGHARVVVAQRALAQGERLGIEAR